MDVENLLSRLSGVRKTGRDSWVARCPAHPDKSPSMSVKALADGRILIHDFAGCEVESILGSLGLTFGDLFPEPLGDLPRVRPAFTALEALVALSRECGVCAIVASQMAEGQSVSEEDAKRVRIAAGRIGWALEFVHGR